ASLLRRDAFRDLRAKLAAVRGEQLLTRLDDAYLALTLPEAEPSAAGAAALAAPRMRRGTAPALSGRSSTRPGVQAVCLHRPTVVRRLSAAHSATAHTTEEPRSCDADTL